MRNKSLIVLTILFIIISFSCNKKVDSSSLNENVNLSTVLGNLTPFAIVDGADRCFTPAEAPGILTVGDNMSDKHIRLLVDVKNKGKWNYSTNEVNGYYFSGSGRFESKGLQYVTLDGHGQTKAPGTDRLIFKNNGPDAKYDIVVLDNQLQTEYVPTYLYFSAKIGDQDVFVYPPYGIDDISFGTSDGDSVSLAAYVSGAFPLSPGSGVLSVQKNFFVRSQGNTPENFKSFFSPGAYPIIDPHCPRNGFLISWADDKFDYWTTFDGLAEQSGSSFKITGTEDGYDNQGRYYVKVFARFNCKLYKYGSDEVKDLVNGEAVLVFKRVEF